MCGQSAVFLVGLMSRPHTTNHLHPSIENPEAWEELRRLVIARDGAYCHYVNLFGNRCGLTRRDTYAHLWWSRPHKLWLLWTRVTLEVDHCDTVFEHPDEKWLPDNCQVLCKVHNRELGWHSHPNYNHFCWLCVLLWRILRSLFVTLIRIFFNLWVTDHRNHRRRD